MKDFRKLRPVFLLFVIALAGLPLLLFWGTVSTAFGGTPLTGAGYLDFSYDDDDRDIKNPTGDKAESKLWWNDGYWWGSMYNSTTNAFHIYRLQWGTQTWVDTGVQLDDTRDPADPENTRADVLWDATANKLYVVSHVVTKNAAPVNTVNNGRLYRYTYDAFNQTYTLDAGFPVDVNEDKSETLVMDKDSTGRLWVTYVSRPSSSSSDYQVYLNTSNGGDDANWGTPFTLPSPPAPITATHVTSDDISALVAYDNRIAVIWSNQSEPISNTLQLAVHDDAFAPTSGWQHFSMTLPAGTIVDDHLSLKSITASPTGQLFAALKLKGTNPSDPEIGLIAIDTDGTPSFHTYSTRANGDTRPIVILDTDANEVFVFVTGKDGGSQICYKSLQIKSPLSSMGDFPPGDCGTKFIEDDIYKDFNNATSKKGHVNAMTGLVVLAGDNNNGKHYGHNVMGDPTPVVDVVSPERNATTVPLTGTISATFNKEMNAATINTSSFLVKTGGSPIAGTITYDAVAKTAHFTPDAPLKANALYTVELTQSIQDSSGNSLNEGIDTGPIREQWQFTTAGPMVQLSNVDYTVNEGGTATISVTLDVDSAAPVAVDYTTVDGTAVAGTDYTTAADTLNFAPGITSQTFTVTTLDNGEVDGLKALSVELSNPVSATLGMPYTATVTILDDESPPAIQFAMSNYAVNEGDGQATISLSLFPPKTEDVTVRFSTSDGTATAPGDYTAVDTQVTILAGETSKTVSVPIIDDSLNEIDKTVNLTLSDPVGADLGAQSTAVLTIVDNDPLPGVQFDPPTYTIDETAGKVTLVVNLSTVSGREVRVDYATGGGTAVPGVDYEEKMGTLIFAEGQTVQSIDIAIYDDTNEDSGETFNVALSNPSGAELGSSATAGVTIVGEEVRQLFLPIISSN